MTIDHLDVSIAFLNGELKKKVYMLQPEEFISDRNKVCKLQKAIYGLKQSSKACYEKIHILKKLAYVPRTCIIKGKVRER